jgi:hypothetical protein
MSVEAAYNLKLQIDEVVALGEDHVTDPTVEHDIGAVSGTMDATTTPAATKAWSDTVALAAGVASLDLTALARPSLPNVDLTGLKVQIVKIACPAGNTTGIEIVTGATNGYNLFGATKATAEKVSILPGMKLEIFYDDELEDVDATHCEIDLSGTGTETVSIMLAAG